MGEDASIESLRLLRDGAEAFPAMLAAIQGARDYVALEMYIFAPDTTGTAFRRALAAAARRGAKVKVLLDAFGSRSTHDDFWSELREAGGVVKKFRSLRRSLFPFLDHRKLLLVDGRIAFIGGLNIADEYWEGARGDAPWRDNALEVAGPAASGLERHFLHMWARADLPLRLRHLAAGTFAGPADGPCAVRFLTGGPENPARPIRRLYREVVRRARGGIDLAMGYFIPPGRVLRELKRAVRRGVRIRLLFPARSDVPVAQWAARGLYGRLLRAGMEVWEYEPRVLHSKLAVADDTVIVGSANLDMRSMKINYELVAVVSDPALAAKARDDFEADLQQARPVDLERWSRRPVIQKVKERLGYLLLARADILLARLDLTRHLR